MKINSTSIERSSNTTLFVICLFLYLSYKTFIGVDFTDEMQYYGQIEGLIRDKQLFSQDLFIQQLPYLYFFPILSITYEYLGDNYLILSTRIVFSLILFALALFLSYRLQEIFRSNLVVSIASLFLIVTVTFNGIFAISYNSLAQIIWIFFLIEYNKARPTVFFFLCSVLIIPCHPPSGIILYLLTLYKVFCDSASIGQYLKLHLLKIFFFLIFLFLVFKFSTSQLIIESLQFSKAFGVGTSLFSDKTEVFSLIFCIICFFASSYFKIDWSRSFTILALYLVLSSTIIVFWSKLIVFPYSWAAFCSLCASVAVLLNVIAGLKLSDSVKKFIFNIKLICLLQGCVYAITSGNGLGQASASLYILIIFLCSIIVDKLKVSFNSYRPALIYIVFLVSLFFSLIFVHIYRDRPVWYGVSKVSTNGVFRGLYVNSEKQQFIRDSQRIFENIEPSSKTLIIGQIPALYFLGKTVPSTCMFFFHSIPNKAVLSTLRSCFSQKKPNLVIDVKQDNDIYFPSNKIQKFRQELLKNQKSLCKRFLLGERVDKHEIIIDRCEIIYENKP